MFPTFKFDEEKALGAVSLVLLNSGGHCKFHKLFKTLYFAERKHLVKYGRPIFNDTYVAMKNGPVPSMVYDIVKIVKGESAYYSQEANARFATFFSVNDHTVSVIPKEIDLDVFSESEIECILESIEENKFLDFQSLTDKSHDLAWQNVGPNQKINVLDIAKAGGANDEMLKYIVLNLENENLAM